MQTEETRRAQEKAEALEAKLGQAQADMAKLSEEVQVAEAAMARREMKLKQDMELTRGTLGSREDELAATKGVLHERDVEIKSLKQMLQERDDELQTFGKTASVREAELQAAKQDLREALEQRNQQLSGAQQVLQQRDEQLFEAKRALKENVVAMKRELCAHGAALTGNISRAEEELSLIHI